jgi:hypothetical protein
VAVKEASILEKVTQKRALDEQRGGGQEASILEKVTHKRALDELRGGGQGGIVSLKGDTQACS